jgi:hypothetical protein
VRWEAACVQHVDVAVQIVQKLDQLIKKFYTGSKLESNSIFIQYLLAKVTDISNISKKFEKLTVILTNCFSLNINCSVLEKDLITMMSVALSG